MDLCMNVSRVYYVDDGDYYVMSECVLLVGCGDLGECVVCWLFVCGDMVFVLCCYLLVYLVDGIIWLVGDMMQLLWLFLLLLGIIQFVYLFMFGVCDVVVYCVVFVDGLCYVIIVLDVVVLKWVLFVLFMVVYGEVGGVWVDEDMLFDLFGFNGVVLWEVECWFVVQLFIGIVLWLVGLYGLGWLQLIECLCVGVVLVLWVQMYWVNCFYVEDVVVVIVYLLVLSDLQVLYIGVDDILLLIDVFYDYFVVFVGVF